MPEGGWLVLLCGKAGKPASARGVGGEAAPEALRRTAAGGVRCLDVLAGEALGSCQRVEGI